MMIREYFFGDWDKVNDLLIQLQKHLVSVDYEHVQILNEQYGKKYLNKLLDLLSKNCGKLFVAEKNGQLCGMVAGIIEPKDEDDFLTNRCPKRGKVVELVVSEHTRSQGIGTKLLRTIEDYFREQGCEFVCVDVFAPNLGALRFYEGAEYSTRNIEMYKHLHPVSKRGEYNE